MQECYICCEDGGNEDLVSVCKCTDRYMHRSCQMKLVHSQQSVACPVCQVGFNNVRSVHTVRRITYMGVLGILSMASAVTLWATCIVIILYHEQKYYSITIPTIVMGIFVSILATSIPLLLIRQGACFRRRLHVRLL